MKRDMDLVREIMLALERSSDFNGRAKWIGYASDLTKITDRSDDELTYHLRQILDVNWVEGKYLRTSGEFEIERITSEGHDFLDATREPSNWEKFKGLAAKAGGPTLGLIWELAKEELKRRAGGLF